MYHEPTLRLLRDTFRNCRVQTLLLDPDAPLDPRADMGLHKLLSTHAPQSPIKAIIPNLAPNTVYRLQDPYERRFLFFLLPDSAGETALFLVGPYLTKDFSLGRILELSERLNIVPGKIKDLETYYSSLPLLSNDSPLFVLLDTFHEQIWGGKHKYKTMELSRDLISLSPIHEEPELTDPERSAWDVQILEERYHFENELMAAVEHGQIHKSELIFSSLSASNFEKRTADPVRNLKNYSIIMNTLLRKAAERGGVHPTHLDRISSDFAKRIESVTSITETEALMLELYCSYCRLVQKFSLRNYSSTIQKVIMIIETDLSANLSLSVLAKTLNISAGYLSDLFRREVGQTLTEFVNRKRIERAKHLLWNTQLQIQTIAQHCGILDVQYFSKTFKKYSGMTPKEYRLSKS